MKRSATLFARSVTRTPSKVRAQAQAQSILEDAADKFKTAVESKRADRLYQELMAVKNKADPNPDLVEGIFYLRQSSTCSKWFNCKASDKPNDNLTDKIVIYDRCSVYLFDHKTQFRKLIVGLTHTNLFEAIIVLAIFLNSLVMALTDYNDRDNLTLHNQRLEQFGVVFSYIFTFELVLKVISFGFIMHPKSYMRDAWNWLDFIVVITGLIELSVGA